MSGSITQDNTPRWKLLCAISYQHSEKQMDALTTDGIWTKPPRQHPPESTSPLQ